MTITQPPITNFRAINFRLRPNTGLYISPLTKKMQGVAREGDIWECDVELTALTDAEHRVWRANLAFAASRMEAIRLSDHMNARPQNYPTGTGMGAGRVDGASQVGRTLITDNWTAGAAFKAGDYIAFDNGTFRELHILEDDVIASGAGAATMNIVPAIRRSPPHATPILTDGLHASGASRCAGEFLIQGAVGWSSDPAYREIDSFTGIEFLR